STSCGRSAGRPGRRGWLCRTWTGPALSGCPGRWRSGTGCASGTASAVRATGSARASGSAPGSAQAGSAWAWRPVPPTRRRRPAVDGALGRHRLGRPVPPAAPQRRYRVDPAGQRVRDPLVVDPPAPEVRPGLLGRTFGQEPGLDHVLDGLLVLVEGQLDRIVGI